MADLVAPLAFALGGEFFAPFIVNLEPMPDDVEVSAADRVRLSVRDVETHVVAGQLQVGIGYAHVRADGSTSYDQAISGAFLTSVTAPNVKKKAKATITPVIDGIEIVKNLTESQRSVWAVGSPLVPGERTFIASAVLRPDLISVGAQGAVFGVEHGYRNTAVYVFFTNPSGIPSLRITGPENSLGVRSPDVELAFDWTSSLRRYLILWNEIKARVEFYVVTNGSTELVHQEPISSFQEFDPDVGVGSPTPMVGSQDDATMVWGIEGPIGDQVTFANVALATDVGFPIVGISRPGDFITERRSDELVRFPDTPADPRLFKVSPWFGPDNTLFGSTDPAGVARVPRDGVFTLTKNTLGTTFAVWREEPGLLSSSYEGFMLEAKLQVTTETVVDGRATGMGFLLYDGQTVWQVNLFGGSVKVVGLLKASGDISSANGHILGTSAVDWQTDTATLRLVVDVRRGLVELFHTERSLSTPILSTALDRGNFPDDVEAGFVGSPAFVAFGHLNNLNTTGDFELHDLKYATLFQSYEARDGLLPEGADPTWARVSEGFDVISPLSGLHLLGGGYGPTPLGYFVAGGGGVIGSQSLVNNQLVLDNDAGLLQIFKRGANWNDQRGMMLETRLQITDHKLQSRSGLFLILDDGLRSYMLSFVDTPIGKFCSVPVRAGLSSFVEKVGTTGEASKLSFKLDWDQPHTYRMELRRLDGLYIFIDNDPEPRLVIPTSDNVDYPTSQFLAPTVAWGQFSKEGSVSRWDFVRTSFSRGYEISFRKNDPTSVLEEEIGNTQALVVASAQDDD